MRCSYFYLFIFICSMAHAADSNKFQRAEGFYRDTIAQLEKDETSVLSLAKKHAEPEKRAQFYSYLQDNERVSGAYRELYGKGYRGIRYIRYDEFPQLYDFCNNTIEQKIADLKNFEISVVLPDLFLYTEHTSKKELFPLLPTGTIALSMDALREGTTQECEAYIRICIDRVIIANFLGVAEMNSIILHTALEISISTILIIFAALEAKSPLVWPLVIAAIYGLHRLLGGPMKRQIMRNFLFIYESTNDKEKLGQTYALAKNLLQRMRLHHVGQDKKTLATLSNYFAATTQQPPALIEKREQLLTTQIAQLQKKLVQAPLSSEDSYKAYQEEYTKQALA